MKIITLPYGSAGWSERTRVVDEILSSRPTPPRLYDDVLILVPSSRLKRAYGALFLDRTGRLFGNAALVPPPVLTLYQFIRRLFASLTGATLMDENSRLVLLEGIVKGLMSSESAFGKNPDVLAPALSAAVADMIEQLTSAGVSAERLSAAVAESDFPDKASVRLLTGAFRRYEDLLAAKGLLDPDGLLSLIADRFDSAWLSPYSRIVIDGLPDAGRLQSLLLGKIVANADCTVLVEAPSPDSVKQAGPYHPLRLTREFLENMGLAPGAASSGMSADDLYVSGTLFSDRPFAEALERAPSALSFQKRINLLSAINPREEATLIAREVKSAIRSGTAPDSILVAFPALDEYGPLIEEIFRDYGIPYNRALGRQLSASPVATAVISLLRACQEDFSAPSLMRVLSSPLLKFGGQPSLAPALDRLMRDRRITGGKGKLLQTLRHHAREESGLDVLAEALNDLFVALLPFEPQDPAPLSSWMKRLGGLIAWAGVGGRVAAVKGPLNINLQAYRKLSETLDSLDRAGRLFPEYRYTFREWLFLLRKTFAHARFQVPPEDEGGVQILGLGESAGHEWSEIYLGGLIDGKFPQRLPQNIFLPEAVLEALGVRTIERARMSAAHNFYRLLLSAPKVTLTYPENEGDRPVIASPFLQELAPLGQAGLLNRGIGKTAAIQFSLRIDESHSLPELAKAVSLARDAAGLTDLLNADIVGMSGIRSAVEHQAAAPQFPFAPHGKREFSVTELDLYLKCPYDYLVARVLGVAPLEEVTEDISPLERGSKVHTVLRNFYLSWTGPVTRERRDEARALLKRLADPEFDNEADTFRNRREKELFLTVMAERFLNAEEEFWGQGMRPVYLEQKIEQYRLILPEGGEVGLSAKIDRIDMDDLGNFIIVDYKTGDYPKPRMNIEQDIFQLPVYAVMAASALEDSGPAPKRCIGLAYYDLAGRSGAGARDVVLFDKDARGGHPSSKPRASAKSADEFREILNQSMDKARKAVEGILAGEFYSEPKDENRCRYCANEAMCEKRDEE
jgi:ATP-dependent helicase/DNAse subunit B